jgi:hypothetical protein
MINLACGPSAPPHAAPKSRKWAAARLTGFELAKLAKSPAVFGFVAVCLIANAALAFALSHKGEIDYLNEVTGATGTAYGDEYSEKLRSVPEPDQGSPEGWLYEMLLSSADGAHNVFADWDGDATIKLLRSGAVRLSDEAKRMLVLKYDALEPVIREKAKRGDGDAVYFAGNSDYIHESVFGITGRLLAAESCIFFVLMMLLSLGYENMAGTSPVIFSSRTGRRLALHKIAAALITGAAFFIVTCAVTYGATFALNDFSQVWGQNVSAQYHTSGDLFLGTLPFITWSGMTIGGYFIAGLGVTLLNAFVCALFAIPFGLMARNVYTAFGLIAGLSFVDLVAMALGPQSVGTIPFAWHLSLVTPLSQIMSNLLWFSDGGTRMLLPRFELYYPLICIAALAPAIAVCAKRFHRKEIV